MCVSILANHCNNFEILIKIELGFFGEGQKMQQRTLTNPRNNSEKSIYQFWQIYATTQRNAYIDFDKSIKQLYREINVNNFDKSNLIKI